MQLHRHPFPNEESKVYPGVRCDAKMIADPGIEIDVVKVAPALTVIYGVLDMPFSVVADTLLLPIDLTCHKP